MRNEGNRWKKEGQSKEWKEVGGGEPKGGQNPYENKEQQYEGKCKGTHEWVDVRWLRFHFPHTFPFYITLIRKDEATDIWSPLILLLILFIICGSLTIRSFQSGLVWSEVPWFCLSVDGWVSEWVRFIYSLCFLYFNGVENFPCSISRLSRLV